MLGLGANEEGAVACCFGGDGHRFGQACLSGKAVARVVGLWHG
jgi:hypothetical protein